MQPQLGRLMKCNRNIKSDKFTGSMVGSLVGSFDSIDDAVVESIKSVSSELRTCFSEPCGNSVVVTVWSELSCSRTCPSRVMKLVSTFEGNVDTSAYRNNEI